MRSLSLTQQQHILILLDSNHSAHQIATIIGCSVSTISRLRSKHRSNLSKSYEGRPSKLSSHNIRHCQGRHDIRATIALMRRL